MQKCTGNITVTDKNKRLIENTALLYMMRIASYIFPLITTPYLTRKLQENNYGIYTWTGSVINYVRLVVDFGFVIYGVEAVACCGGDKGKIGKTVRKIIECKALLCIVMAAFLAGCCFCIGKFREHALMIFLTYLSGVISVFGLDFMFQGMEQMRYITIRTVLTKMIFTVLVFVFVRKPEQYLLVPILTAVGEGISVIIMWRAAGRLGIKVFDAREKVGREFFGKSSWYFLSRISGAVSSYGNIIVLGLVLPEAQVAQYSIAYSLIAVAQSFITPVADSLYPYMVKNKNFSLVKKIIFIAEPVLVIACIIGGLIAAPVITFVFGKEYNAAAEVFCRLLPIVLVTLPGCLLGFPTLSALGLYREANAANFAASVFHIVGLAVLYSANNITIFTVAVLTSCTEWLVFTIRGGFVAKTIYEKRR